MILSHFCSNHSEGFPLQIRIMPKLLFYRLRSMGSNLNVFFPTFCNCLSSSLIFSLLHKDIKMFYALSSWTSLLPYWRQVVLAYHRAGSHHPRFGSDVTSIKKLSLTKLPKLTPTAHNHSLSQTRLHILQDGSQSNITFSTFWFAYSLSLTRT